ncbi:MAG: class A beta-lactamase-related serine hydrolase [Alphaproteobacteria bacterium]|nr:MAG: class A beta-lactamase-related serine hydrolase [Alphaproteobacteria bacterium]
MESPMSIESADQADIFYPLHGKVAPGFEAVQDAFETNFADGQEVGASFAVYRHGQKIVDLWGGYGDKALTQPWEEHSLANVWSTTKGMAALVVARLVEQGKISYDAPVITYWPEFGAHGKDKITVGQMLSHQAGVSATRVSSSVDDFYVPHLMAERLADTPPLWEPGTRSGYHALTFGFLVGELVFRVTGKSLGTLFREEVAGPLGADFYIGLPESEDARAVELIAFEQSGDAPERSDIQKITYAGQDGMIAAPNRRAWRAAEIPAAGGQANAHGAARVYAALANGGDLDGVHVLSPETMALATHEEINNKDLVLGVQMSWGRGFVRNLAKIIYGPNPEAFGHSGWGGSFAYADPVAGLGVSYVMNRMNSNLAADARGLRLVKALYQSL